MIRDNYLDISRIIKDKKILKLFRAVENHGGVLRFVGGCVRDAIAGLESFDLDLATDLSPDEMVEACEEKSLRTIPIGIKFGTVGVLIDDAVLEVTSLRRDVSTDGRRAVVEFTDNWEEDAARRDLTINAVYADEKGNVFDYYNGLEDLEKGIVRFIGKADERIKEDYLRILRFFRFHAKFAKTEMNKEALKACIKNKAGLKQLSVERINAEFRKLVLARNAVPTLKIISENNILGDFLPKVKNWEPLEFMVSITGSENLPNEALRRLFILFMPDKALAEKIAQQLKFTKKYRGMFVGWAENKISLDEFSDDKALLKIIYKYGKDFAKDKFMLEMAVNQKKIKNRAGIIEKIDGTVMPIFPIRGKDLIENGVQNHYEIGKMLDELEQKFIDSDFSLSRDELLKE